MITSHSSNSDRTINSAQSFLLGLVPELPIAFEVDSEETGEQVVRPHPSKATMADVQAVTIHIANLSCEYDPLLHGFKGNVLYDNLRAAAFDGAQEFERLAREPDVVALVDKLWQMSGFKKLSPEKPLVDRLKHMQSVQQQIMIERAHRMPLLANTEGLCLNLAEEQLVKQIADFCCHLRYQVLQPQ
uniref:Uncharacterized protein n=1 Tax=Haptolina brevifila TaxID=156173 RepID=A0A7S2FET7_9EUKA|mmetsp:Transcript_11198/g.22636  ORF Transcript_11198/g.22636 Transcript_11198/m.22636 type:complete len:187 (+) Transcript_11198:807-1367(+)